MSRSLSTVLLAAWVTLTLGVPFLLIAVAGRVLPVDVLTCVRFALGCGTLLVVAAVRRGLREAVGEARALVGARPWEVLGVGVCSAALPSVLLAAAERHVLSGTASLLLASTPVWIALGAALVLPGERLAAQQAVCLAVAFCGTALLATGGHSGGGWAALPLAAAVSYAAGSLLVRRRLRGVDPVALTCSQMAVATVLSAPFALAHAGDVRWQAGPWLAVGALGVVCSGLGWAANTVLVQRVSAVRASLVSFAAPVVSVALGAAVLGERLAARQVAAAGLVLGAVAAFGLRGRRPSARARSRQEVRAVLELAILGFLAEQPMHAYELRRSITALVGHVRPVSDGALYPALDRLRRKQLLTRHTEPGEGGPPRQVLDLTDAGRGELLRRLADADELDVTDRNRYFVVLAFLHLLPSAQAQQDVLRRRLDFLRDPRRAFFVTGERALRGDELDSPFRAGIQRIARATSAAEQRWLVSVLDDMRAAQA